MYQIDFNKPQAIHFIGIGGISMSGLAEILLQEGFLLPDLFRDGFVSVPGKITGAARTAENAAPAAAGAVPVGAGHAAV